MSRLTALLIGTAVGALGWAAALSGCASDSGRHQMTADEGGVRVACAFCYEKIEKERRLRTKHPASGRPSYPRVYACEECDTSVEFYEQDGKLMFKCARCAPEGVACDRSLPPK